MATIDRYKMIIDVVGADKIKSAKKELSDFNSAVLTFTSVALAGLIASAGRLADELQDLADATGINVGKINALGQSLQQAGGDAKDVGKIITTFYKTLEDMATGGDKAEESLSKVGIGFKDLKTLSSSQLLDKAIEGLANMEAGAARTALGIEIFGKAFAKIDPTTLEKILATKDFASLETEMKKVAAAAQSIETSFSNMQQATIKIMGQLIGKTGEFTLSVEDAEKIVKILAATLAIAFGAKVIAGVLQFISTMRQLNNLLKTQAVIQATLQALSGPKGWAVLAGSVAIAGTAIYGFNKLLGETEQNISDIDLTPAAQQAKKYGDAVGDLQKQLASGKITLKQFQDQVIKLDNERRAAIGEGPAFTAAGPDATKEEEAKRRVAAATALSTKELIKQNDLQRKYQEGLNKLIGDESTIANIKRSNAAIDLDYAGQILRLRTEIATEESKGAETNKAQVAALSARIPVLEKERDLQKQITAETIRRTQEIQFQKQLVQTYIDLDKQLFDIQDSRVDIEERSNDILNKTAKQREREAASINEISRNISAVNSLTSQGMKLGNFLDPEKAKEYGSNLVKLMLYIRDIGESELDYADKKNRVAEATANILSKIPEERRAEMTELIGLMTVEDARHKANMDNIKVEQDARDTLSQSMAKGAIDALEQIGASMTPFQVAQDAVTQTFNTMASSLDTFVKEGKFKFKDFARTILTDIGLMIAKMYMFQAIQAALGAFGIGLPGIPGKAMGGPVGKGMPYMVGEKGPELFVPKQAGTIIPNNKLDSASATTAPQAPGPVTNVYNNYSISAIDSQSVAQFFAQNRKMALGAVTMAQKELSYGS